MGALEAMAAATKLRVTETLVLDGALDAEWTRLQIELGEASRVVLAGGSEPGASLADPRPRVTAVAQQMEEIREQVADSEVTFVFEALDWQDRAALQTEHPPRPGVRLDELRGYNADTYDMALIRVCCVQVTSSTDEGSEVPEALWDTFLPKLSSGQFQKLRAAANEANEGSPQVPPSARFLLETQDSEASSTQPSPGQARRRSGSKAGSRRTSPRSSSATKKAASSG